MDRKKEILEKYLNVARRLGKVPSLRETERLICSERQVNNHFGKFNKLKEEALKKNAWLRELEGPVKITEKDIDQFRIDFEANKNTKHNKKILTNTNLFEYIEQFVGELEFKPIKPVKTKKNTVPVKRSLNLTLSDLHLGADTKSEETGNLDYGTKEEARRLAVIVKETVEYKPLYRKNTELVVNLLGDVIQNKLHDVQDAAPMAEQAARAIFLLTQVFAQLAEHFPQVTVYCNPGNHGRDLTRHKSRASSSKWDCIETVIYFALKRALSWYSNVKFIIPKTPFVIYEVFRHKVFATHGDNVLSIGNPGKVINVKGIQHQLNTINATLKDTEEVKVAIVGHTHCASVSELNSGVTLITNGCLEPIGQFPVSIGILEGKSSQTLFEMTPEHSVGDIRFIRVTEEDDKNSDLDKIIKPFEGF